MSKHVAFMSAALLSIGIGVAGSTSAAIISFTSQSAFEAQLGGAFTLVNLDAAPLSAFATPYRVEDALPAAAFLGLGIDFFAFNAQVIGGQNFQTPTNRDRLIVNGLGLSNGGLIAINLVEAVNGVGAFSNDIDFGRVRAFSEANLGGTFIGETQFGPGSFGGLTSDVLPIRSVQFTCDFNQDRICGVYDIQFGTFAIVNRVSEPVTLALLGIGLAGLGLSRRKRAN